MFASVPVMMEQMHQRAGRQKRKWKKSNDVRAVFREQEVRGYRKETEEDNS